MAKCGRYILTLQQDGTPSHILLCAEHYRVPARENDAFIERDMWPPNSPNLNPVDYAIWEGALQEQELQHC